MPFTNYVSTHIQSRSYCIITINSTMCFLQCSLTFCSVTVAVSLILLQHPSHLRPLPPKTRQILYNQNRKIISVTHLMMAGMCVLFATPQSTLSIPHSYSVEFL